MSKSRASKTRGYAARTGVKAPEKAAYDNKKCSQVQQYQGEQISNNLRLHNNRIIKRMQGGI